MLHDFRLGFRSSSVRSELQNGKSKTILNGVHFWSSMPSTFLYEVLSPFHNKSPESGITQQLKDGHVDALVDDFLVLNVIQVLQFELLNTGTGGCLFQRARLEFESMSSYCIQHKRSI